MKEDGTEVTFDAVVRIDTPGEADYYRNGGILPYVLRQLVRTLIARLVRDTTSAALNGLVTVPVTSALPLRALPGDRERAICCVTQHIP